MSATRDLIAAALRVAGMYEPKFEVEREAVAALRELCARTMVQQAPDMAEVSIPDLEEEDLLAAYHAGGESGYRRGLAERDALIADNERLSGLYEQAVKGRAPAPTACRTGKEN